jgi:O-antigen/teichoic acid export membrane protein
MVLGLVTALGIVMLPRMSNVYANGDREQMNSYLNIGLKGVAYVAIPMSFGIAGISNEFVPWFFGPGFEPVIFLMTVLTPILFFIAMSNVLGIQYLLPSNRTREYTASVTAGAFINLILNLILIPKMKALGACIGTVAAEFVVAAFQYYCLRKEINIKDYLKGLVKYSVAAMIMFVVVRLIGIEMGVKIGTTIVQCLAGVIIYILILTILREKINSILFIALIHWIRKKISPNLNY